MTTTVSATISQVARTGLQINELIEFDIDLASLQIHDSATGARLGAAGTDDLGYSPGTFATGSPMIISTTASGTTVTQYARFRATLPECYVAGSRVQIKFHSRVEVAGNVSGTIDLQAFKSDKEGGIGSDLASPAAQSINTAVWADKTFEISSGTLAPGDVLDCRITIALDDTAGANAQIANIGKISLLCNIQG